MHGSKSGGNIAQECKKRVDELKGRRNNFDDQWQQVKDLVWPDGGDFTYRHSPGEKTTEKIYEMTASLALEKGAAALEAFLTPRTTRWHRLVASDERLNEQASVKRWFEQATDVLFKWRNAPYSRFYGQVHEVWKSNLAYGNACMLVEERPEGGVVYRQIHVGSAWIETDHNGKVDTIYREYELTARAACKRWGDKAPRCAKDALHQNPFAKHTYLSVVRPSDSYEPGVKTSMAYEALEISCEDEAVLEQGGFHELPYIWTRYTVSPHEEYGRGPAMMVLPDIKTLQEMQKAFMRAGHKVADPPLLVADDGVLGRGSKRIRISPGGINVGGLDPQGNPKIMPLQTGARLDLSEGMMETLRDNIREALGVDLFDVLVRDRVQMTATEVLERQKEKGQLLTPVVGRQQSELLGPLIDREIKMAMRQGQLPPMPDELVEAQGEYDIEYESSATRMQKSDEILGVQRAVEVMMPWIEADPTLLQMWKNGKLTRHVNDTLGVPSKLIRTENEYEQIEAEAQQAAAADNMMTQAPQVAQAVRNISEMPASPELGPMTEPAV